MIVDRLRVDYSDGIIFENLPDLKRFWNRVCRGSFRLIYRPAVFDDQQLRDELDTLADWVLKCGNMAFLVEELNVIYNYSRFSAKMNECIFAGRKRGVELITISQRPKGYGQDISSQAGVFNVFQTHHPDDLRYFAEFMNEAACEAIKELKQYEYVEWDFSRDEAARFRVCKDELLESNMDNNIGTGRSFECVEPDCPENLQSPEIPDAEGGAA